MNRSLQIREWLATQDGPRRSTEIAQALGLPPGDTYARIGVMVGSGLLIKNGERPHATYEPGRTPAPRYATDEERKAAIRATNLRHKAMKRMSKAEREKFTQEREAANRKPTATTKPDNVQPVVVAKPIPSGPKPVRVESIDDWMRRTGRTPEHLEPGACSKPLKRIGWQPASTRKKAA